MYVLLQGRAGNMADLDGELSGDVGEAHGQHGLALAEGARTATEVHILEFGELRNNIMMYVSLTSPTVFATSAVIGLTIFCMPAVERM